MDSFYKQKVIRNSPPQAPTKDEEKMSPRSTARKRGGDEEDEETAGEDFTLLPVAKLHLTVPSDVFNA